MICIARHLAEYNHPAGQQPTGRYRGHDELRALLSTWKQRKGIILRELTRGSFRYHTIGCQLPFQGESCDGTGCRSMQS